MKIIISHIDRLPEAVKTLMKISGQKRLFALYGPLGSGKTTIIKAICREMGAADSVGSPSFTIVNEYRTSAGEILYHIDFYRIKKQEEVFDLGIEEYFYAGNYCFMEWPELVEEILPSDTFKIRISVGDDEVRILETD